MRFVGDIALDAEVRAIASGAITDGAPVIVNADGTVTEAGIDSATQSLGTAVNFDSGAIQYASATFDSNSNRVVIAYRDYNNSNYGTAIVGTISGTSVSYGTAVVFESAEVTWVNATFDSNNNKIVISYADAGNSNHGTAIVGTVDSSDNSISFGSATVFNSATTNQGKITFDSSNNKVVIAYNDGGNSGHGYGIVGTVSGTSISFGSAAEFENAVISDPAITFDTDTNQVIIAYRDEGNSNYGTAIVGTVSGTSISFGSPIVYHSVNASETAIAYDSNAQRIIVAYTNGGDGDHGYAAVGSVGTTEFDGFGTSVEFRNADERVNAIVFDSNANKVVVAFREDDDSNKGKFVIGTVATSGNTVTFDASTLTVFVSDSNSNWNTLAFDSSNNKVLIAHGGGSTGRSLVLQVAFSNENLTSENFIGFAHAAYADGQKATVKTTGSIARNIPQVPSASDAIGSAVIFESGDTYLWKGTVYDTNSDRLVIFYIDGDDSNKGKAIVGTVSGNSVTFGTAVTFISETVDTGEGNLAAVFDSNANKVVVFYKNSTDTEGRAHVGTVDPSDNSISFGSEATFNAGNSVEFGASFDSTNNKIVVSYRDYTNSQYGTARVGTVSGTSISFGTAVVFNSGTTASSDAVYDPDIGRTVIAYRDEGNSGKGTAIVGTISGTDISFGSEVVFDTGGDSSAMSTTYDTTANKVIIAYKKSYDSNHSAAIVGTVSGTSISFGSSAEFATDNLDYMRTTYVSSINKIIIAYADIGNTYKGTYILGTVSGTSISFNTEAVYTDNLSFFNGLVYDPDSQQVIFSYWDDTTGDNGTVKVLTPAGALENLTIGQQYFVQTDGTLGTSADSPSVIAGTAIGASDIIVKG